MTRIAATFRNLLQRPRVERELELELRSYQSMLEDGHMANGMNSQDARRSAKLDMGGPEQVKETIREARAGAFLDSLWRDIRFGARTLRKTPGFTAVAALTLALGIGANTAIFSIVDSVILRPFPYADAARTVAVRSRTAMFPGFNMGISWMAFERVQKETSAFERVVIYQTSRATLNEPGHPERVNTAEVSDGFFDQLGVRPQLGRLFIPQDFANPGTLPVVLNDAFWHTHYGADPSVINRTILVEHKPFVVVGVAPLSFHFYERVDLWSPISLTPDDKTNPTSFNFILLGKLNPTQTVQHAQVELNTVADRIRADTPALREGFTLNARTLVDEKIGSDTRKAYMLLWGAATCVFLIACANLASLLLARGWARQREMALRTALGASRGRVLRQSLVESCLLGVLGGGLGMFLAIGAVDLFRSIAPPDTPRLADISVNPIVFAFALVLSLASGIFFGLAPALRAAKLDPNQMLNAAGSGSVVGGPTGRHPRLGNALVVAEVALAFILMIGAALTTTSLSRILHVDSGMSTDHLLMFDLPLGGAQYHITRSDSKEDAERTMQAQIEKTKQIVAALKATPGVEDAISTDHGILAGQMMMYGGMTVEGAQDSAQKSKVSPHARSIGPGFFKMMQIPLVRGRDFADTDVRHRQPVAIVNAAFAKHYWDSVDVIGKHISFSTKDDGKPDWAEVIGVAADTRDVGLEIAPSPEFYVSNLQVGNSGHAIIVRTATDPLSVAAVIPKQIWKVDPEQPIGRITTATENIQTNTAGRRLRVVLLAIFAGIGLTLALLGVYGVLAYSVARRTREIGIRMSLGAQPGNVLRLILRHGLGLAFAGVLLGVAGAIGLSRFLASELFEIKPTDPATYAVSVALMISVALIACFIPARRATRTDPMVTLRHQ